MGNDSTDEIDDLAAKVECIIAQNEEVLTKYKEEHTSFSDPDSITTRMEEADPTELFS